MKQFMGKHVRKKTITRKITRLSKSAPYMYLVYVSLSLNKPIML